MAVFTALQSEYLLQLTALADPTVAANGAVGKTNSCKEAGSVCEAAEICFQTRWDLEEERVKGRRVYRGPFRLVSAQFRLDVKCAL